MPRGGWNDTIQEIDGDYADRGLVIGAGASLPLPSVFGEGSPDVRYQLSQLQGLEDASTFVPTDNPLTVQKIELG